MPILGALANGGTSSFGIGRNIARFGLTVDYLLVGGGGGSGGYQGAGGGAGGLLIGSGLTVTRGTTYTIQVGGGGNGGLGSPSPNGPAARGSNGSNSVIFTEIGRAHV